MEHIPAEFRRAAARYAQPRQVTLHGLPRHPELPGDLAHAKEILLIKVN
jgi:hypothetical protein